MPRIGIGTMKSVVFLLPLLQSTMLLTAVKSFTFRSAQSGRLSAAQRVAFFQGGDVSSFCTSSPVSSTPSPAFFRHHRQQQTPQSTARLWLSSAPTEGETSVVETCREKIATALETDEVTVIGTTSRRADSVCLCVWRS